MVKVYNELKKIFTLPSVLTGLAVALVLFWVLPLLLPETLNNPPDYASFYYERGGEDYQTLADRATRFIQEEEDFTQNGIETYRDFALGVSKRIEYLTDLPQEQAEIVYEEFCAAVATEENPSFTVRLSKETAGKLYEKAFGFPYDGQIFSYFENHLEIPEEPRYTFLLLQAHANDTGIWYLEPEAPKGDLTTGYNLYLETSGVKNLTQEQYYSLLPKVTFTGYIWLLRNSFLALAMGLATVILLSRNISENKTLRALQYMTRTGKNIVYYKTAALAVISFVVSLVMMGVVFVTGKDYGFMKFLGGYINNTKNQSAAALPVQMNFGGYIFMTFVSLFLMTLFICLLSFAFDSFINNNALRFFMLVPMGALSYWLITFMTTFYKEDPLETLPNLSIPFCEVILPLILCGVAMAGALFIQKRQERNV